MGRLRAIVLNQPFDICDAGFREEMLNPSLIPSREKFYILLGTFMLTDKELDKSTRPKRPNLDEGFAGILAALGQEMNKELRQHYVDTLRTGVKLGMAAGLPSPSGKNRFYTRLDNLDLEGIRWGAKVYHALVLDAVFTQVWTVDRKLMNFETRMNPEFTGDYDHRVIHGNESTDCVAEHDAAAVLQHHAAFERKVTIMARDLMMETFWSKNQTAANFDGTWRMYFDDAEQTLYREKEDLDVLLTKLVDEGNNKYLDHVIPKIYRELGGLSGKVFL